MVNLMLPMLLGVVIGAWLAVRAVRDRSEDSNAVRVAAILTIVAAPIALAALGAVINIITDMASPMRVGVATLVSGLVGATWLVAAAMGARVPRRYAWGAIVALALLALVAVSARASMGDQVGVLVILAPIFGLLAVAPAGAGLAFEQGGDQRLRWAAYGVGTLLALSAVGALPAALWSISAPPPQAEHHWELQIDPETAEAYVIEIHALHNGSQPLGPLPSALVAEVEEAGAQARWVNGTLHIEAQGSLTLDVSVSFFGAVEDREAFPAMLENVTARVTGTGVHVTWFVDSSSGSPFGCRQAGLLRATVPVDSEVELIPGDRGPPQTECA